MAKNKSKKQQKKLVKQLGDRFLGGNVKNATIALASILLGALVEDAVKKMVQKTARKTVNGDNPIQSAVATVQDRSEDAQSTFKDKVNTVSSIFSEVTPILTDLTQRVARETMDAIGNTTETAANNVSDTARNFVGAIADRPSKKDKKKDKKKQKKS